MSFLAHLDRSRIWFLIILLTAMSFPWSERINAIGILLLSIHWVADAALVRKAKKLGWKPTLLVSWAFVAMLLIGIIWTKWPADAGQSLQVKSCMLLLPLFFSTENHMNRERWHILLFAFSLSCLLSFFYLCGYSFVHYRQLGLRIMFSRMYISFGLMHPGYYSNYLAFALTGIMLYFTGERRQNPVYRWYYMGAVGVIIIALLLMQSKTVMVYLLVLLLFILWRFTGFIQHIAYRIGAFALAALLGAGLFLLLPPVRQRLAEAQGNLAQVDKQISLANSTGSRQVAWSAARDLISRKWLLGYGTGAANHVLFDELHRQGYHKLADEGMHTHNQYLHTWLDVGLPGILLMLLFFGIMLFECFRRQKTAGIWLILLIGLNLFTDDMLEIQAGMVFFMFFLSLMVFTGSQRRQASYT